MRGLEPAPAPPGPPGLPRATGLARLAMSLPHLSAFSAPPPPGSSLVALPCPHRPGASLSSEKPHAPAAVAVGPSPQLGCLLEAGALGWAVGATDCYPSTSSPLRTSAAAFCPVCEPLRAVEHVLSFPPQPSAHQRKAWKCRPPLPSPARAWLLLPFSALPETEVTKLRTPLTLPLLPPPTRSDAPSLGTVASGAPSRSLLWSRWGGRLPGWLSRGEGAPGHALTPCLGLSADLTWWAAEAMTRTKRSSGRPSRALFASRGV